MANEEDILKLKKSKDRSEKKKRKHVDDDGENHVSSKKSKSASTSETKHSVNGRPPTKDLSSSINPDHLRPAPSSGSHDHIVNGIAEETSTPSRKKKKSKPSKQANLEHDVPGILDQEAVPSSVPSKKNLESSSVQSVSSVPPSSGQKSNPNGKGIDNLTKLNSEPESSALDRPTPMEIDSNQPQPIINLTDIPYIERSLRSILTSAWTPEEETTSKSPFFRQATQFYLPLSPITLSSALEGVCAEHLSPLLLKYHPPLHGVVLSYAHPRFSKSNTDNEPQPLAISVAEYATPMIWLDVEILLFKPARGHAVEGLIVLQTESYIGLQVYNLFSGRISRTRMPADWKWTGGEKSNRRRAHKGKLKGGRDEEGQDKQRQQGTEMGAESVHDEMGYWVDGKGAKVDGVLKFWVWDVDIALGGREAERNLPTIEGTLIEESVSSDDGNDVVQRHKSIKAGKRKV